ncbi:DNA repair exonuclease subunit 1 protein [Rhizobium phage RHph_I1_18]|nr:DNA repair exonuclease subunit 1 protein [Rhizobium phage RHph_I1_18]
MSTNKNLVGVISDCHFGIRKTSKPHRDNLVKFLREIYFPKLDELGIKHVINAGDMFDERKKIDTSDAYTCRAEYYDKLKARGITEDLIIGNHDIYMRESNMVNSATAVLGSFIDDGTLRIHEEASEQNDFLFVPWINKSNYDRSMEVITRSKKRFCIGHLELNGFTLHRGQVCTKGYESDPFDKFELTLSGHFHFRSRQRNIVYLGSPTQHNWQDVGDVRGFHTLDTETGELTFYRNPFEIYATTIYDNKLLTTQQLEQYRDRYVRVYYNEIEKESQFKKYREQLVSVAHDVQTIKVATSVEDGETIVIDNTDVEVEDTITMLQNESKGDVRLFDELMDLHTRAQVITRG